MPSPHQPFPHRWAALGAAALLGLACVALLLAGSRANAAPPDVPAPPPALLPGPARLAPAAQLTPTICPRDVALVFDVSGSMGYDPVCRGCWYKTNTNLNDIPPLSGSYPYYYTYPDNGAYRTIPSSTITSDLCAASPATKSILYPDSGTRYRYQVIEAELYSRNTSILNAQYRERGKGYWVLQRDGSSAARFNNISSEPGTYIQHMPERTFYSENMLFGAFYTAADAESGASPRVEYQFSFEHETGQDWRSIAGIWVRVRRGPYGEDLNGNSNMNTLYWALDRGSSPVTWPPQTDRSASSSWTMVHLTDIPVEFGPVYTLKLYAGSSGYAIDRIFITDNSSVPSAIYNGDASPGSAHGEACDLCNPIYGLTVTPEQCAVGGNFTVYTTTNWLDPQFSHIWQDANQPMRTSKEALKNSVQQLDPLFDQVSLVTFTSSNNDSWTKIASELTCFQASRRQRISCYDGAHPISYTYVLRAIEQAEPQSMTCTSCGMRFGLQTLGLNTDDSATFDNSCTAPTSHCGRGGGANKVMILITDGTPNDMPIGINCDPLVAGGVTYDNHYAGGDPAYSSIYDCVLNYAEMAGDHGITLYTVGVGLGTDGQFMTQVAELGHGAYYSTTFPSQLDLIVDEILSSTAASCIPYGLSMAADGAQSGLPGQGLVYTHILTNLSYYPVTADLTFSDAPPDWPASVSPVSQTLEAGQAVTVTVVMTVPPGSLEGVSAVVRLVATLQGDETISATVVDTTTIGLLRGVDVEPPQAASGRPGQVVTYTHVVTNTGNGLTAEVFTISVASGLWSPAWQPPTMSLAAGTSAPLTVTLLIPAGTPSGTFDVLTVTVISQADPDAVFDLVTDTTTIGWPPPVYLPIVLKSSQAWTQK